MKESLIIAILLVLAIWPAIGQGQKPKPHNVSVGESTVLAYYPEMAEFVFSLHDGTVTIIRYDVAGNESRSKYPATFTQPSPNVYRADFAVDSWVEVNTENGSTNMSHKGTLEAFFPASFAGK